MLGRGLGSRGSGRCRRGAGTLASIGIGALLAYLFDRSSGARRRHVAVDRTAAVARRTGRRSARFARYARGTAHGYRQRLAHRHVLHPDVDDATLVSRVRSEVFRDHRIPKGNVNVMADNGVVVLHGHLDDRRQVRRLVRRVEHVDGVRGVDNRVHAGGTESRSA